MCGITGFFNPYNPQIAADNMQVIIRSMTDSLIKRGPDDYGVWVDAENGIAFGHRRLSIVDLSAEGHQPMRSPSGRYMIVFNGEIYNFKFLRKELETAGYIFRGHSDTEIMLAAIEVWGLENSIKRFVGMFAFALWDCQYRLLHLCRDRLGEKPLYYGWHGQTFLFGSELKALRVHPEFRAEIDRNVLSSYIRHGYIQAPYSIYKDIYKLMPGTFLTVNTSCELKSNQLTPYWILNDASDKSIGNYNPSDDKAAIKQLDLLLKKSIDPQMIANVPLGAFLSGGIDSSTVVALMQAQSILPVKTFTIGFEDEAYNEAEYAKTVAKYLGTDHTELYVTANQAMDVIPNIASFYDEPFSDSSQIATILVARLAKRHVTVSLSGDGGDELFSGYSRYMWMQNIWNKVGLIPPSLRLVIAELLRGLSPGTWNQVISGLKSIASLQGLNGDQMHKLAGIIAEESPAAMYCRLVSLCDEPTALVLDSIEPLTAFTGRDKWTKCADLRPQMMQLDTTTYLPDDILVKVDRACMGVSLESRVPFLDYRIVDFAFQLPMSMKVRNGQDKWLLRQVLYQYLPRELFERPKMGFGVPIGVWLCGPLREWAEELISEKRLKSDGFFNPSLVRQKWNEHLTGKHNWQHQLWSVLMFQAWLETQDNRCGNY